MSPCLNNLLAALRAIHTLEAPPLAGEAFFRQMDMLASLDAARSCYYTEERSQQVFDWVQQYQAVLSFYGSPVPVHLQNAPFSKEEWARLEQQAAAMAPYIVDDYLLDRIDVWILEAYTLQGECEALPGDVVFDCGTYTGNTSLYFSQKVGASGHVYGFEAQGATFEKYVHNMRGVENVTPIRAAVSNTMGTLRISGENQGARIADEGEEVPAISIDEFCRSRNLTKIDFIKMDVEGAEENALIGAANTILRHRPKMAISAYHKSRDLIELPARILGIAPYTFKLRHFSDREWETVLYCMPDASESSSPSPPGPKPDLRQWRYLLFLLLPLLRKILRAQESRELPLLRNMRDQRDELLASLQTATQGMHRLMKDITHLHAENAALKKALEKHGTTSGPQERP